MKVVILAGGFGTRISEESHLVPKPMIEIGGKPILWHIMKSYAAQGFDDFIICCGYKQNIIKDYFAAFYLQNCDVTFDFRNAESAMTVHNCSVEPWRVTLVDTGLNTMTGGRVKRVQPYTDGEAFMLTYGDGLSNVDLQQLLAFHRGHGRCATLTSVKPEGRLGVLDVAGSQVLSFREKSKDDVGWSNAGFMVLEPEVFNRIEGDETILEHAPLESLARDNELMAFRHNGFWQCMDTQRDKQKLETLWNDGEAPWKIW